MRERRLNEIRAVILIAAGLIILASLVSFTPFDLPFYISHPNIPPKNFIRTFGAYLAGAIIFLFGWASYIIPFFILFLGVKLFRQEVPVLRLAKLIGVFFLVISLSAFIGMFDFNNQTILFSRAGLFGFWLSRFITAYFGRLGGFIIFITFILLSFVLTTDILISAFFARISSKVKFFSRNLLLFRPRPRLTKIKMRLPGEDNAAASQKAESLVSSAPKPIIPKVKIQIKTAKPEPAEIKAKPQEIKIGNYRLPTLDLLDNPPILESRQTKEDLEANARVLEETLDDFGISAKVTDIERGPAITRYELEPAPGVKVNRIEALDDDIALAMRAPSVRILAPIPGKARVGVEVPNSQTTFVYLKEVLASNAFTQAKFKLALPLGKDITGRPIVADLDEMPHLLIAGTTGSGKTVCVNSLILSLLFKNSPDELKFLMVDPKRVELMPFNDIPHLLCPVVTDAKKVSAALNWVLNEMDERYRLLAKAGTRNIESYNEKNEKLPYIIVIIDEFADLMVVAGEQIENAVTRLAQMARAVGIHLVLATQRPSVDVITGVIKANLPARISFKVASKVDSRTVLDANGAEKLLGKGDMLFMRPGESELIRIQGTLVSDKEIERVTSFVKSQGEPVFNEEILKEQQKTTVDNGEKDDLYDEAVRIVMESNQASASILQRRLRLGYTRAARIIDTMEQEGLVGPFEGSKPRKIIVDRQAWLEKYASLQQEKEERH
ncbi:MAG: DNA translocase FtsK [Candidatus Omnitrophica bacterium]|nr:DNA translocase FtsK [Candidatus Omnitrophota bacterium]